jgi:putative membrane protein
LSELNDPRVLFAAERTLLAWVRTASGLMALGFIVDRAALVSGTNHAYAVVIGLGFLLVGVLLSALSVMQYRASVATLRPPEIPPGYWVNLSVFTSAAVGLLGLALAIYVVAS